MHDVKREPFPNGLSQSLTILKEKGKWFGGYLFR